MIGSKLCGTSPAGKTLKSTANVMTLHFHTDINGVKSGFRIFADAGKKYDKTLNCLTEVISNSTSIDLKYKIFNLFQSIRNRCNFVRQSKASHFSE